MKNRKYLTFGFVFFLALLADHLTKVWARASLSKVPRIVVVDGFFDFRYSENPGSAFGFLREFEYAPYVFFAVGLVALFVIGTYLRRLGDGKLRIAAELGLLAGGAVGNIVDRIRFGRVTDFVLWKIHSHEWPIFNVADAALLVGVVALIIDTRGEDRRLLATGEPTATPATPATPDRKPR